MSDKPDHATVIGALDTALLEQAVRWRSIVLGSHVTGETGDVDWVDEFCVVVRNRLDKLQRQRVLAKYCMLKPGEEHTSDALAVRQHRANRQ